MIFSVDSRCQAILIFGASISKSTVNRDLNFTANLLTRLR